MYLFDHFPVSTAAIRHTPLGAFPTPVRHMDALSAEFPGTDLYVKDDGRTAASYGGNKVRKLEFLLGDALQQGADTTVTFGFAGSNHALATAVHARACGMNPVSILLHQPNAAYVRKNLLYSLAAGTEIIECGSFPEMQGVADAVVERLKREGRTPYVIPPGGSSPLGNLGYVNAAVELKHQLATDGIPVPDIIYLPLGTMGTVCGLALGLKLAGIRSRIKAVCVVDPEYATAAACHRVFGETRYYLAGFIPAAAAMTLQDGDIGITTEFYGPGYAEFTGEGMDAIRMFRNTEKLELEGSYSGKTAAAMLADAGNGELAGKNALFWKTCNTADFTVKITGIDYHNLPDSFHRYFETDTQPLDN